MLDDAAFGAATEVTPKFISPADPAARWTGAHGGQAFFAYATNYLVDVDHGIIVDVEATTAMRQAEVTAAKRAQQMIIWNAFFEIELVKQPILSTNRWPHHRHFPT